MVMHKDSTQKKPLADLVRSVVGPGTSRQIARLIEARGGGKLSHATVASLLRGDVVSDSTLFAFSLAFGIPFNDLREAAGLGPLASQPWASLDTGSRVIKVADLAAVLAGEDGWDELNDSQRTLAINIGQQQLHSLVQTMRQMPKDIGGGGNMEEACVVAQ